MYRNRLEAGGELARSLRRFGDEDPLVLARPNASMILAEEVVREIGGEIDVLLDRPITVPRHPSAILGLVDEFGLVILDQQVTWLSPWSDHVARERTLIPPALESARDFYTPHRGPIERKDRTLIYVEEAPAHPVETLLRLRELDMSKPRQIIFASVITTPTVFDRIGEEATMQVAVSLNLSTRLPKVHELYSYLTPMTVERVARILSETELRRYENLSWISSPMKVV